MLIKLWFLSRCYIFQSLKHTYRPSYSKPLLFHRNARTRNVRVARARNSISIAGIYVILPLAARRAFLREKNNDPREGRRTAGILLAGLQKGTLSETLKWLPLRGETVRRRIEREKSASRSRYQTRENTCQFVRGVQNSRSVAFTFEPQRSFSESK